MTFADVLGARGTVANLPAGARTTTIESKTNFFAAGVGPVLLATAIPLHIGRTTMVWQTTIRNADRSLVAVVTQTQIVLPARKIEQAEAPGNDGNGTADGAPARGAVDGRSPMRRAKPSLRPASNSKSASRARRGGA
jgi:hypothetical protein